MPSEPPSTTPLAATTGSASAGGVMAAWAGCISVGVHLQGPVLHLAGRRHPNRLVGRQRLGAGPQLACAPGGEPNEKREAQNEAGGGPQGDAGTRHAGQQQGGLIASGRGASPRPSARAAGSLPPAPRRRLLAGICQAVWVPGKLQGGLASAGCPPSLCSSCVACWPGRSAQQRSACLAGPALAARRQRCKRTCPSHAGPSMAPAPGAASPMALPSSSASSSAWLHPWDSMGVARCAASPTNATRPRAYVCGGPRGRRGGDGLEHLRHRPHAGLQRARALQRQRCCSSSRGLGGGGTGCGCTQHGLSGTCLGGQGGPWRPACQGQLAGGPCPAG